MRVRGIWFNHSAESERSDAVLLADADNNPITTPEWVDGEASRPVAYARTALARSITVKVSFTGGRPGETVAIRAISERPGVGRTAGAALDFLFGPASVLGAVSTREVRFGDNGESEFVSFEIRGRSNPPAVGVYQLRWTWQVRISGRWVDFGRTDHKLYLLAAVPAPPWSRAIAAEASRIPWPAAVELACQWASGATSVEESTDMIARAINEHPKHKYDSLASHFASHKQNFFDLSLYLWYLVNEPEVRIDCRGTAGAVATFANLLGAELYPLIIENVDDTNIQTKLFRPFADTSWVQFPNWTFHEVAAIPGTLTGTLVNLPMAAFTPGTPWPAGQGTEQLIYDAIPHFNSDAPVPAVRIPVGLAGAGGFDYRFLLIAVGAGDLLTPAFRRDVK